MNGLCEAWTARDEQVLQLAELLLNHEESMVVMLRDAVERQGRSALAEQLEDARRVLSEHKAEVKRQWATWLRTAERRRWASA